MANWALTYYRFKGASKEQVSNLYEKIDSLAKMTEPLVENDFGNLWMGCLVNLLGGDWNEVYCRGYIIDYNIIENEVSINCETAWDEMPEFRHFIEQQYPGSKIYYQVEECGCEVYATNDTNGDYFPDRYCFDSYDGLEYFETLEEAAKYIGEIIGKDLNPDIGEIENAIDDYMEEHDNDDEHWMSFHKFKVYED